MKFTSEDLMKAMGLQVGDRVKVKSLLTIGEDEIYTIDNTGGFCLLDKDGEHQNILKLMERDYELLPRPKRVGDLKCDDIPHSDCTTCPIKILCLDYGDTNNQSFYEILKDYKSKSGEHFDQEIHDLLKARLDKEVKE